MRPLASTSSIGSVEVAPGLPIAVRGGQELVMAYASRQREHIEAIPLRLERTRVLLAEGNTALREVIARALRDDGYDVIEVRDSSEALACMKAPPHLIIRDTRMPAMSG